MKKILSILLALMLLISVGTVMAFAADDFTLTVAADKTEAAPGDEVTFTFTLAGTGKYDCISFKVEADSGLEYVSSETGSGFGTAEGAATVSFDNKNGFYMFSGIGSDIAAGKLFTAKYKVSSSAAAGAVLNVKVSTDKTGTSTYSNKDKFILSYNNVDKTCAVTNGSVKVKSVGVGVSGSVTSYTVGSMTGAEKVTVSLMNGDTIVSSQQVTTNYSFSAIPAGTYTLKVEKLNHVTRNYIVTVGSANVTQDVKICPKGDANSDGAVKLADYTLVLAHVKGTKAITDEYALACADVNGDGSVKLADYTLILAHVKGTKSLF